MRIGEVIGTVTLTTCHPSLAGGRYRLVVPLSFGMLTGKTADRDEELVVYDELGAGLGDRIAFSEGAEAAQPFYPKDKPIDAYNSAILDHIQIAD